LLLFITGSCKKDDPLDRKEDLLKNYSPVVRIEITGRMLEGKQISCIEPDYKGNTWIASGKEFYVKKGSEDKTYTLDFPILDISIAADSDNKIWIGTSQNGVYILEQ
jgi:hypothetical protein